MNFPIKICIGSLFVITMVIIYRFQVHHQRLSTQYQQSKVRFPYPTYIVPEKYDFLIPSGHLCYGNGHNVTLAMLVPSSLDHFAQRQAIRKTWGSVTRQQSSDLRLGFVVGITENSALTQLLHQESEEFNDIIQSNFLDVYENLAFKSFVLFKWFSRFCYNSNYLLKVDDDVFVNVPNLLEMLKKEDFGKQQNFVSGFLISNVGPIRDETSKYFVSEEEYINDTYPKYIAGSAYVTSGGTAIKLYLSSTYVPLLSMEDIFFTGLCAEKIKTTHIPSDKFLCSKPSLTVSNFENLISTNDMAPSEMEEIWIKLGETKFQSNSTVQ